VVPQNTPKWSFLVGKPMVVGYHHFRKPIYIYSQWFFFKCWLIWLIYDIYGIRTSISLIFMVNLGKYTSDWWEIIGFPIHRQKNRGILWMQDSWSWDMPVETQTTKMFSASSSGGDRQGGFFYMTKVSSDLWIHEYICTNKHKKQKKQG